MRYNYTILIINKKGNIIMTAVAKPAAQPITSPEKDGLFVSGVKFGAKSVLNTCRAYTIVCDTGITIGSAVFSCTKAVGRAALSTWNNGIRTTLRSIGSSTFGLSSFGRALDAIQHRTEEKRDFHGVLVKKEDKRDFAERLGEASAHLFNGTCRLIAVGGGTTAYTVGTVSNLFDLSAQPDSLHQAAKSIASGFNTIASYVPSAAWNVAKAHARVLAQAGTAIRENPETCAKGVLLSASIYMATSHLTKAVDKPGFFTKLYHTACAVTGLALTVAIAQAQFSSQRATLYPTAYA